MGNKTRQSRLHKKQKLRGYDPDNRQTGIQAAFERRKQGLRKNIR